jgi:hypothetical protein
MELLKKHVDTVVVLGGILGAMLWMNGKFNDVDRRLIRIETILIMKGIMPSDMAAHNDKNLKKEINQ